MDPFKQTVIVTLITACSSSGITGFITFLINRHDKKKGSQAKIMNMLLGLGHDRIMTLGEKYEERGYITYEEFDDFNTYLYQPYKEMGGNGTGEEIYNRVRSLPRKPREALNGD